MDKRLVCLAVSLLNFPWGYPDVLGRDICAVKLPGIGEKRLIPAAAHLLNNFFYLAFILSVIIWAPFQQFIQEALPGFFR